MSTVYSCVDFVSICRTSVTKGQSLLCNEQTIYHNLECYSVKMFQASFLGKCYFAISVNLGSIVAYFPSYTSW